MNPMQRRITLFLLALATILAAAPQSRAQGGAPSIVVHPTNRVSFIGGSATLSVTATGAPPLFYRWIKDGVAVPRGTNRLLNLINLVSTNAGDYAAIVTNAYGSVTSQLASLTLTGAPPSISSQPVDRALCPGGRDSILVVQAGGSPPFTYQWNHNGVSVPNSNTNRFSVSGNSANLGDYFVVVNNPYGARTSVVARLRLGPIIVQEPVSQTVHVGSGATFTVIADGCSELRYQWRYNGTNITGYSTNDTLSYQYFLQEHSCDMTVVVSDSSGSVTSVVARLEVLPRPPVITRQPDDALETGSPSVLFQVEYSSQAIASIQWRFNGANLPGANGTFLRVWAAPSSEGGYTAVVSNSGGSVTSRVAVLTLRRSPPVIYGQPLSQVVCPSGTNNPNLQVGVYEQGLCSFQWWKNGVAMPGETNSWLYLTRLPGSFGDYFVVVTNYFGSVTSVVARVSAEPVIVHQSPELTEADAGTSVSLFVEVRSCSTFRNQWQRDGVDVPGATGPYLSFYPLTLADSGDYRLIVRHSSGSLTSTVARLEVLQRPPMIDPDSPQDQEVRAGEWASFEMQSYDLGAPAGTFQWRFNGVPIPGENGSGLGFIADSLRQQGRYSVVLSNEFGSVTGRIARLTLLFSLPFFEVEPEDIEVPAGQDAYFFANAVGAPPPTYQWLFNDHPIRAETNDYLSLTVHGTNQVGGYSVVASNFLGAVTSRVAAITLQVYPPGFLFEPQDVFATAGNRIYLYTSVTGAPPPSFQWFHHGSLLTDETNDYLTFIAGFSNQIGGYSLVASNELGLATSRVAMVQIVLQPLSFVVQPLGANLLVGESANLYVVLANNLPAHVQWQRDGIDLPGATNPSLYFRRLTTNDSGNYVAIARNDLGSITSLVARLDVRLPGPLDHWIWRRPLPQGNHLEGIAFGNGRHVSVGTFGGVAISTNGTGWFDGHQDAVTSYRTEITYGNGVFLTLDNGWPQTSTNGLDWLDGDFGGDFGSASIAFGNGRFVAVNYYDDRVATSTNGVDWELQATAPAGGMAKIVFAGGMFMAPALSFLSPGNDGLFTSPDGIHWTVRGIPPVNTLAAISYGDGLFVGIPSYYQHYVVTSTNGIHWTERLLPQPRALYAQSIAWGNGVWVTCGSGTTVDGNRVGLEWSNDAIHWTAVPGIGTNSVREVLFDGTRFVAVGAYGFLATSTNGADWAITNPGSDLNLRGLSHANGLFLTVGNGGLIYTSPDGRDWTRRSSGTTANLRSSTFFGGRFIVVGGDDLTGSAVVLSSSDASDWQPRTALGSLYGVTHNGHRLVAVGDGGAIATSLDGMVWTNLAPFTEGGAPTTADLNAILWTGDRFMAVGKDGTIITSTNGLGWTSTGPGGGKNLKGIAYGNGVYVAVGNDARVFTSSDGRNWQRRILEPQRNFEDITFGGGRFLAVGENGALFTSDDGTDWLRRVTVCNNDLRSVIFAEGSYYAAGNNETILQSGQTDAALRITHGSAATEVLLELLGETGRAYRLQGSADLANWTDLHTFTAGPEPARHTDPSPAAGGWRFFRLISP